MIQAILNISRNALDAVADMEADGRITLRSRIDHQTLTHGGYQQVIRIDVQDNGTGVDQSVAAHVFEPMVSGKAEGRGLGLSITAEIIRNHNGLITLASEPGSTVFSVFLGVGGNKHEN